MKKQQRRSVNKLDKILDLPKEVVSNNPKFTITGFNEIFIENYKGILEYEEYYVKINTYMGTVNINGFNLNLKEMSEDDVLITGKIESINFEDITD